MLLLLACAGVVVAGPALAASPAPDPAPPRTQTPQPEPVRPKAPPPPPSRVSPPPAPPPPAAPVQPTAPATPPPAVVVTPPPAAVVTPPPAAVVTPPPPPSARVTRRQPVRPRKRAAPKKKTTRQGPTKQAAKRALPEVRPAAADAPDAMLLAGGLALFVLVLADMVFLTLSTRVLRGVR